MNVHTDLIASLRTSVRKRIEMVFLDIDIVYCNLPESATAEFNALDAILNHLEDAMNLMNKMEKEE